MIRHCESDDDVLDCYGGASDFNLTERGIATATAFADTFATFGIQKIFTSPYKRAHGVASIFAGYAGAQIGVIDNLREINTYGVMCGTNKDLAREIFGYWQNKPEYKSYGYYKRKSFYGGEDVDEFDARVRDAFDTIAASGFDTVAIVTHGGVFRSVFQQILKRAEHILEIEDCAVIEIEYTNGEFRFVKMDGIKTE